MIAASTIKIKVKAIKAMPDNRLKHRIEFSSKYLIGFATNSSILKKSFVKKFNEMRVKNALNVDATVETATMFPNS